MLRLFHKDVITPHNITSEIYYSKCQYDADYIVSTGQSLEVRINQYAPITKTCSQY